MSINRKSLIFDSIIFAYFIAVLAIATISPTEETLLNLKVLASWAIGSLIVSAVLTVILNKLGILTLGLSVFEPKHLKLQREPTSWWKTFWGIELLALSLITFVVGIQLTQFSFYELFDESGFLGAQRIFTALANPEWSILPKGILAIVETIFMAFMSTALAIPVAFLLAFFCAKNIMGNSLTGFAIYVVLRTVLNVTRSIEPLIWAIIFSVWVGIGPFAGMLALLFHSVASLTKQYSEIIEGVDSGPIDGIAATGANKMQVIWFGIVPQIVLPYISFTIYRWDINVRMATIIGLVGGGGIGTLFIQYQGQALWNEVGTLALLIVIVVWSLDTVSAYIREALK